MQCSLIAFSGVGCLRNFCSGVGNFPSSFNLRKISCALPIQRSLVSSMICVPVLSECFGSAGKESAFSINHSVDVFLENTDCFAAYADSAAFEDSVSHPFADCDSRAFEQFCGFVHSEDLVLISGVFCLHSVVSFVVKGVRNGNIFFMSVFPSMIAIVR